MIEDLTISINTITEGESEIDSLVGSLETLDATQDRVDPVTIDVDVNDVSAAMGEISSLTAAAEAADETIDIGVNDAETDLFGLDDDATIDLGVSGVSETMAQLRRVNTHVEELDGKTATLHTSIDDVTEAPSVFDLDDDTIELDVDVDGTDEAISDLTKIGALAHSLDGTDIDLGVTTDDIDFDDIIDAVSDGGIDTNDTDGGAVPDGDDSVAELFQPMSMEQLIEIRESLGEEFDPRGLLREDITLSELEQAEMDEALFTIPSDVEADRLIDRHERDVEGLEQFIDWNEVFGAIDEDGLEGVLSLDEDEFEQFIQFPTDESDLDQAFAMGDFFDTDQWGEFLFGDDDPFGDRDGGVIGMFSTLHMGQLWDAVAKLVPLLLVFVGALPAAITGVAALAAGAIAAAGALLAIGGLAVLGGALIMGDGNIQEGFTEILSVLKEQFLDAFIPLARMFDDLFFDALNMVGELFRSIAAQGDVLIQLKDDARALMNFIVDFIPAALRLAAQLAEAFMPLFAMFGEWLMMNFDDILRGMVGVFAKILPSALALIDALIAMLPIIIKISIGFFMVASLVVQFISVIFQLIGLLGPFGTLLGFIIGLLIAFASITSLLATLYGLLTPRIAMAILSLYEYATAAWAAMVAEYGLAAAALAAALAVGVLLALLTFGLAPILASLGGLFGGLAGDIDNATKSLNKFSKARGGFGMGGGSYSGLPAGSVSVYDDNSKTVYNSTGETRDKQRRNQRRQSYRQRIFAPY